MDFRKAFDTMDRNNSWNRLEGINVPLELRIVRLRLYKKIHAKFKSTERWSKYINCNIGVKQGCSLFPTLFIIYINKLESCLEEASCSRMTLAGIVVILLYVDDHYSSGKVPL